MITIITILAVLFYITQLKSNKSAPSVYRVYDPAAQSWRQLIINTRRVAGPHSQIRRRRGKWRGRARNPEVAEGARKLLSSINVVEIDKAHCIIADRQVGRQEGVKER